jgi:hypothetical protein
MLVERTEHLVRGGTKGGGVQLVGTNMLALGITAPTVLDWSADAFDDWK